MRIVTRVSTILPIVMLCSALLAGCGSIRVNGTTIANANASPSDFVTVEASPTEEPVAAMTNCDIAMSNAADVDLSQVNDIELVAAAQACPVAENFMAAIQKYPLALGAYQVSDSEAKVGLQTTCDNVVRLGEYAEVCDDAFQKGLLYRG